MTALPRATAVLDNGIRDGLHLGAQAYAWHAGDTVADVALDALDAAEFMARCIPGGGGRGPMRQLARLYRALLNDGELDGVRILSPQTVAAISARHRTGLFDETFRCECDWGLGFAVDNFAMGRHASRRAFGHGGALSSYSFVDPEHDLVVAVQTNGMCASDAHYQRLDDVMTALYLDLGIVAEDAKGRDKPMPSVQF